MSSARKPASDHTRRRLRDAHASLPPDAEADFADARRGLVATYEPPRIAGDDGKVVWDLESLATSSPASGPRP